ncbi:hypothetical protein U9M48_038818, partial [Paspalum notatum var. saurae]
VHVCVSLYRSSSPTPARAAARGAACPNKFFLWLASQNRCWTADRLARRGLPHPACCVLCDQGEETVEHLLVSCVFVWQVWSAVLDRVGLRAVAPSQQNDATPKEQRKGLNSLVILVAWSLWKHRNRCVLDGLQPAVSVVVQDVVDLGRLWVAAGAAGLRDTRLSCVFEKKELTFTF